MKTAVVTGGASGIGYGLAQMLEADGYRVVVMGRHGEQAVCEAMKMLPHGVYVQGDLSSGQDRERLLDIAGNLDVLVNNAGVAPKVRSDVLDMTEESYDYVMDINLKGTFFLTQSAAKRMIAQGSGGCIINISSMSAYTSSTNRAQYCISKAGIGMVTKIFADRLAEYGIGVYELRPGIIETDMIAGVRDKYDTLIYEKGILPIRRYGTPEDIGRAVCAIAGGALAYSTGEVINIDGGFHLQRL